MGEIFIDIIVFLGILFLLVLIIAPIIYYVDKDKADEKSEKDAAK